MNQLALMTGVDIPIGELQITLHQPSIKEISLIGETEFFSGLSCLCIDKNTLSNQDKSLLGTSTNFQIFMAVMSSPQEIEKKQQTLQVLMLLFPEYKVFFTPLSLVISKDSETHTIDDSNFSILQKILKSVFCLNGGRDGLPEYNPKGKRAQEIAEKLMRGRQRTAEEKAKNGGGSMLAQYLSVITVGIQSMSLDRAMMLTVYQIYDLIERYSRYTNWDIDIKSRLAGAKMDSDPPNWMENIH